MLEWRKKTSLVLWQHVAEGKKLVVSPSEFDNEITCCGLEVDEVIFKFFDVEEVMN